MPSCLLRRNSSPSGPSPKRRYSRRRVLALCPVLGLNQLEERLRCASIIEEHPADGALPAAGQSVGLDIEDLAAGHVAEQQQVVGVIMPAGVRVASRLVRSEGIPCSCKQDVHTIRAGCRTAVGAVGAEGVDSQDLTEDRGGVRGQVERVLASAVAAQDWPQWRGPARDGRRQRIRRHPDVPSRTWPDALNRQWSVDIEIERHRLSVITDAVEEYAAPVLVGDRIYMFTRQDGRRRGHDGARRGHRRGSLAHRLCGAIQYESGYGGRIGRDRNPCRRTPPAACSPTA